MFTMTDRMTGNEQLRIPAAVTAVECWPSLVPGYLVDDGLLLHLYLSGVWLVMGVKAKLKFEVSCFDNGFDCLFVFDQINNAVAVHGFQGPGQVAFFSSRNFCQFLEGTGLLFQDDFEQLLVVVVQDLGHRMQRLKPYLRFMSAGLILAFGDCDGSLLVFIRGNYSDFDNILFHFFTWLWVLIICSTASQKSSSNWPADSNS